MSRFRTVFALKHQILLLFGLFPTLFVGQAALAQSGYWCEENPRTVCSQTYCPGGYAPTQKNIDNYQACIANKGLTSHQKNDLAIINSAVNGGDPKTAAATPKGMSYSNGKDIYTDEWQKAYAACMDKLNPQAKNQRGGGGGTTINVINGPQQMQQQQQQQNAMNSKCSSDADKKARAALKDKGYADSLADCEQSSGKADLICAGKDGVTQGVNQAIQGLSMALQLGSAPSITMACQSAQAAALLGDGQAGQLVIRCEMARSSCIKSCNQALWDAKNYGSKNSTGVGASLSASEAADVKARWQEAGTEISDCQGLRANSIAAGALAAGMGTLQRMMVNCSKLAACSDPSDIRCASITPIVLPPDYCTTAAGQADPKCAPTPSLAMCDDPNYANTPTCVCQKNPTSPTCVALVHPTPPPFNLPPPGGGLPPVGGGSLPPVGGANLPPIGFDPGGGGILDSPADPQLPPADIKSSAAQNPGVQNGGGAGVGGGGGGLGGPLGGNEKGAPVKPDTDIITGKENGTGALGSGGGVGTASGDEGGAGGKRSGNGAKGWSLADYLPGRGAIKRLPAAADQELIQAGITPAMGLSNFEKVNLKINEKYSQDALLKN